MATSGPDPTFKKIAIKSGPDPAKIGFSPYLAHLCRTARYQCCADIEIKVTIKTSCADHNSYC